MLASMCTRDFIVRKGGNQAKRSNSRACEEEDGAWPHRFRGSSSAASEVKAGKHQIRNTITKHEARSRSRTRAAERSGPASAAGVRWRWRLARWAAALRNSSAVLVGYVRSAGRTLRS